MIALPREPCALLCSGGIESSALAFLCSRQTSVRPIYVRSGLIWEDAELRSLRNFLASAAHANLLPLAVLDQPVADIYRNHWSRSGEAVPGADDPDESVYLPGRNLLLLAKGAVFCSLSRLSTILVGTLLGNPFPDASPEFFAGMGRAISLAMGHSFRILAPFCSLHKEDVIRLAAGAPLELSFSCIHPRDGRHCGRCNKCGERKKHFLLAGVRDKTDYANGHAD
ncbi:MAG: 7-cyano-7-deazaguanine synthase [Acidobacteria bacterium]|nr:7-cyano-7-deazaguanine synthase [Acidobacteriota bacterium]